MKTEEWFLLTIWIAALLLLLIFTSRDTKNKKRDDDNDNFLVQVADEVFDAML